MGLVVDAQELRDGVAPLTHEEHLWIRRLERVLRDMPARMLMIEVGGGLEVVDRAAATHEVDLEDGRASRNGVVLATVDHSIGAVCGVSG